MTLRFPPLLLGPTTKGFWCPTPVTRSDFVAAGHTLTDGSLTWPVLTLDADAVVHNLAQLAAFTGERGLAFAPHGKTTMSPELFAAQLDAGAWGITVATGNQLLTAHSFGVRRLLVANQVLDLTVLVLDDLDNVRHGFPLDIWTKGVLPETGRIILQQTHIFPVVSCHGSV